MSGGPFLPDPLVGKPISTRRPLLWPDVCQRATDTASARAAAGNAPSKLANVACCRKASSRYKAS